MEKISRILHKIAFQTHIQRTKLAGEKKSKHCFFQNVIGSLCINEVDFKKVYNIFNIYF